MMAAAIQPATWFGRWNLLAHISSEPGTTGMTVLSPEIGPPVKKY